MARATRTRTVILYPQDHGISRTARRHLHLGAVSRGSHAVDHSVLHEWFQDERGHHRALETRIGSDGVAQATAKSRALDFQVVAQHGELLSECHAIAMGARERIAQDFRQAYDGVLGEPRVLPNQARDGVHSVEEKMRIRTRLKGFELGSQRRLTLSVDTMP